MVNRNRSIDVFRAVVTILILTYHCWVLTGALPFRFTIIGTIVSLGGEIGVTAFFALSGYGIYYSILSDKKKNQFSFIEFMKKRCIRIVPQYYFSMIIAIILMDSAVYLSSNGMKSIITHLFFVHNLFLDCSGSINGVLWTMGVIVQFYIISNLLFIGINKGGVRIQLLCIAITIVCKMILFAYVLPSLGAVGSASFFAGRQLVTSLDNFTTGMFVAYQVNKYREKYMEKSQVLNTIGCLAGILLIYFICLLGKKYGIHTNNISGYVWHSGLSLAIGVVMFFTSNIKCDTKFIVNRILLWISKYEYGIYIWQILIINNLVEKSEFIKVVLNTRHPKVVYIILISICIFMGYVMTTVTDNLQILKKKEQ